jgi:hypothetical protein
MLKLKEDSIFRKIIPRKLLTLIKFYQIFNQKYGHSHFINGFVHDGNDNPIPWITYPCIEFLNRLDLKDCDVFEYGSGSSSLYWSKKSKNVFSIEKEQDWFLKVEKYLPKNCNISHAKNDKDYIEHINTFNKKFDIIIVDGAVRYPCAQEALKSITERGIIILDNTEWYPNTAKLLTSNGYTQIDFIGFPPINAFPSTTSIFYKSNELINNTLEQNKWAPMGGRYLNAYDDVEFGKIDENLVKT